VSPPSPCAGSLGSWVWDSPCSSSSPTADRSCTLECEDALLLARPVMSCRLCGHRPPAHSEQGGPSPGDVSLVECGHVLVNGVRNHQCDCGTPRSIHCTLQFVDPDLAAQPTTAGGTVERRPGHHPAEATGRFARTSPAHRSCHPRAPAGRAQPHGSTPTPRSARSRRARRPSHRLQSQQPETAERKRRCTADTGPSGRRGHLPANGSGTGHGQFHPSGRSCRP